MDELYLIALKSRGVASFDVAERMPCPKCTEAGEYFERPDCSECDGAGHWWITNAGFRAYPYWSMGIEALFSYVDNVGDRFMWGPPLTPPVNAIDLFPCNPTRSDPGFGKTLLAKLGLVKKVERRL